MRNKRNEHALLKSAGSSGGVDLHPTREAMDRGRGLQSESRDNLRAGGALTGAHARME